MNEYIESLKGKPELKVLFVCLGNICRSPAAEAVMLRTVEVEEEENSSRSSCPPVKNSDTSCPPVNNSDSPCSPVKKRWVIDSAGTGDYHIGDLPDSRMRAAAARRGIPMTHRCRQVKVPDFYDFDLIIGMDASNLRNLRRLSPTPETDCKILPMAAFFPGGNPTATPPVSGRYDGIDYVPDPYYEGQEGFELVLDMLAVACRNLYRDFGV